MKNNNLNSRRRQLVIIIQIYDNIQLDFLDEQKENGFSVAKKNDVGNRNEVDRAGI